MNYIRSSAIIMWSNVAWYCIYHWSDWGRVLIKVFIDKMLPIPCGVVREDVGGNWPRHDGTALYYVWITTNPSLLLFENVLYRAFYISYYFSDFSRRYFTMAILAMPIECLLAWRPFMSSHSARQHYRDGVILMETLSVLLALCAGNSPLTGEFPAQRPVVARNFDVFYLCLNKRLS